MASDAQIRANRANAQKSTGPRTSAGKDGSRLNATTHNITGTVSLRSGPEKDAFDAYFERLMPDFHATTDLEYELASRVIDVMFRLARISILEGNILSVETSEAAINEAPAAADTNSAAADTNNAAAGIDQAIAQAKTFIRESRTISNLSLYEQRLSRTLRNALATLDQLRNQKPKKGAAYPRPTIVRWVDENGNDTLSPVIVPPLETDSANMTAQPGTRLGVVRGPGKVFGFVFSKPETGPARPVLARPKVEIAA